MRVHLISRLLSITGALLERALWAVLALALAGSVIARADVPRVTLASGLMTDPARPIAAARVLLRLSLDGVGHDFWGYHCAWALIDGDVVLDPRSGAERRLPYMNVRFVGANCPISDGIGWNAKVGIAELGANIRLRQSLNLRVEAIGMEWSKLKPARWLGKLVPGVDADEVMVVRRLMAEVIGLKLLHRLSLPEGDGAESSFLGLSVGELDASIGAIVAKEGLTVRVVLGVAAELNVGSGWATESNLELYGEITSDVARYLRFFVRNSYDKSFSSEYGDLHEYRLLAGAAFTF